MKGIIEKWMLLLPLAIALILTPAFAGLVSAVDCDPSCQTCDSNTGGCTTCAFNGSRTKLPGEMQGAFPNVLLDSMLPRTKSASPAL